MTVSFGMTAAAEEAPTAGPAPDSSTVNTVEFALEDGQLSVYLDGELIATMTAGDGKIVTGMSDDGRIWVKTDDGVKKVFTVDTEKPVDLTLRGALKYFATDPSFTGDITLAGGSSAEKMKLAHSGGVNAWGSIGILSIYNTAKLTANDGTDIDLAYLYNQTALLKMLKGSSANTVYTDYRNENLSGKSYVEQIAPLGLYEPAPLPESSGQRSAPAAPYDPWNGDPPGDDWG